MPRNTVLLSFLHILQNFGKHYQLFSSVTFQAVQGAGMNKEFHCPTIESFLTHSEHKILKIFKSTFFSLLKNGFRRSSSYSFHSGKSIANRSALDGKSHLRFVDIRRKNRNPFFPGHFDVFRSFNRVIHIGTHGCGVKLRSIVALQIGCLIGKECIAYRMRLVKGIFCKINHLIIDAIRHSLGDSLGKTSENTLLRISVNKVFSFFFHNGKLLLTHGTSKQIRSTHAEAGEVPNNLHNLLLIHDNTIGVFQDWLHFFTIIFYLLRIFLSCYIVRNKVHGTRTIECHSGNNVIQIRRLQTFHKIHHTSRFQLENACTVSSGKHRINLFVLIIQFIQIQMNAVIPFDKTNGILYHRKGSQSQEIHL